MKFKFLSLVLAIFFVLPYVYSNVCVSEPDEYVLKCTFKKDLYERDFMCLDLNCSDKIYGYDEDVVILEISDYKSIIVYNGIVNLQDITGYTKYLRQLCEERISDSFLGFLNRKIRDYDLGTNLYSGEKIIILPYSAENYEKAMGRTESNSNLLDCYENEVETSAGWLIESRKLRSYCEISEEGSCISAVVNKWEFLKFLINDKSALAMKYLLTILLGFGVVMGIFGFFVHLIENRALHDFFKIDKYKLIITLIIMIPLSYVFGYLLDLMFFEIYYRLPLIKEGVIICAILVSYIVSSFIYYYFISVKRYKRDERLKRKEGVGFDRKRL